MKNLNKLTAIFILVYKNAPFFLLATYLKAKIAFLISIFNYLPKCKYFYIHKNLFI